MEQSISYWENAAKSVRTNKERWYKHHLGSKDTSAKHRQKKYLREVLESREERKKNQVNRSKLERSNRDKRLQDNKIFVQEWDVKQQQQTPSKKQGQLSFEEQELLEFLERLERISWFNQLWELGKHPEQLGFR
jgi:hypothetical protein